MTRASRLNGPQRAADTAANFVPRLGESGFTESSMQLIRAAAAKTRAGVSDFRISGFGDSETFGVGTVTTPDHWLYQTASRFASALGVPLGAGHIFLGLNVGTSSYETQITKGAGWANDGAGMYGQVGRAQAAVGAVTSLDIAFTETITSANVYWVTGTGVGDLIYSWNGGSKVTVTNPGGAYAYANTSITAPSRGVHVLNLWQAATGSQTKYGAVEPQDSAQRKVRFYGNGISSMDSAGWVAHYPLPGGGGAGQEIPYMSQLTKVNLHVAPIGVNDCVNQSVQPAALVTNVELARQRMLTVAPDTTFAYMGQPPFSAEPTAGSIRQAAQMELMAQWGAQNGAPAVTGLNARWGSYLARNPSPYNFYYDLTHPNGTGYADWASTLFAPFARYL